MNKRLNLLALASLCSALYLGAAVADSDVITLPNVTDEEHAPKSCAQAQRDAEFIRELKRTDGDTNPELPAVPECAPDRASA
jgi:hypothetical protein